MFLSKNFPRRITYLIAANRSSLRTIIPATCTSRLYTQANSQSSSREGKSIKREASLTVKEATQLSKRNPRVTEVSAKNLPPKVLWGHEDEFGDTSIVESIKLKGKVVRRISSQAFARILSGQTVASLLSFGGAVYVLGGLEAWLMVDHTKISIEELVLFMNCFAGANLIPSIVHSSIPSAAVAHALDINPEAIRLYADHPVLDVASHNLRSLRSILASFGVLSQVFRIVNISTEAGSQYHQRVLNGNETLLPGINQRFFRLCGRNSEVTATTLKRCGNHVVPVIENLESANDMFWKSATAPNSQLENPFFNYYTPPLYIHIKPNYYGSPNSWRHLAELDKGFFLRTRTGRSLLCMEADGTAANDPMSLLGLTNDDLDVESATQGFKQIERMATRSGVRYRTLRVLLGSQGRTFKTGAGNTFTLRERLDTRDEVDVVIDPAAPILKRILKWCQSAVKLSERQHMALVKERDECDTVDMDKSTSKEVQPMQVGEALGTTPERLMNNVNGSKNGIVAANRKDIAKNKINGVEWNNVSGKDLVKQKGGKKESKNDDKQTDTATTKATKKSNGTPKKTQSTNGNVAPNHEAQKKDTTNDKDGEDISFAELMLQHTWTPDSDSLPGTVVLETSSSAYYEVIQQMLNAHGISVMDVVEYDRLVVQCEAATIAKEDAPDCDKVDEEEDAAAEEVITYTTESLRLLPRLIIHMQGSQTVNAITALENSNRIQLSSCCVVVPDEESAMVLDEIAESETETFQVICAAQLYDDLFRQVRSWARLGYSNPSIQTRLDMMFGYFYQTPKRNGKQR